MTDTVAQEILNRDVIVLDIGGTNIRVGHIKEGVPYTDFEVYSSKQLCIAQSGDQLLSIITNYVQKHSLDLMAAVLGIPGMLDRTRDKISHCNNIPELEGNGLCKYLTDNLGCFVLFEQDIMLQLLGEWRAGAAEKNARVFGVYFGTGIGAAYLIDGDPYHPLVQNIQAGHIPIMAEGRSCLCGNTDCIEAYASGHILTELANRSGYPVAQLFSRTTDLDWLKDELDRFIMYQAYMLATICTLFNPQMLVIGGGIPLMADYPRQLLIEKTITQLQKPYTTDSVRLVWASLTKESTLHGAMALLDINLNTTYPATQQY